ncbi:MAG: sigma-70 family RNA polymerase sigma factor [Rikenellaceae bacterium]|nr:sigma-70 family RNA polymerase sigma factor [Rikenellaceae bacterium]
MTERQIIEGCCRGDAVSQRELYERFSGSMYGICLRYVRDKALAEDILHDGFITVFTKIGEFRGEGSFEGWCRRIFVNTALGHLRKKSALTESESIDQVRWLEVDDADAVEKMSGEEVLELIDHLPQGYRTILNLYAVEGYSHKEIGEMLGISENTSRSQYFRARGKLIEAIGQSR